MEVASSSRFTLIDSNGNNHANVVYCGAEDKGEVPDCYFIAHQFTHNFTTGSQTGDVNIRIYGRNLTFEEFNNPDTQKARSQVFIIPEITTDDFWRVIPLSDNFATKIAEDPPANYPV